MGDLRQFLFHIAAIHLQHYKKNPDKSVLLKHKITSYELLTYYGHKKKINAAIEMLADKASMRVQSEDKMWITATSEK